MNKAEEAARLSEERYRELLTSVTDYIYTVHLRDGVVVGTSHGQGCLAVTGYPSEEYARDPDLCGLAIDENGRLLAYHAGENTKTPPPDVDHDFERQDLLEPAAADAQA